MSGVGGSLWVPVISWTVQERQVSAVVAQGRCLKGGVRGTWGSGGGMHADKEADIKEVGKES